MAPTLSLGHFNVYTVRSEQRSARKGPDLPYSCWMASADARSAGEPWSTLQGIFSDCSRRSTWTYRNASMPRRTSNAASATSTDSTWQR